jgi:FkbM family methyltransferase
LINKYCKRLGFEIHGTGYMQSLQKASFKENAFLKQKELMNGKADIIFDIGANYGDVALQYHGLFPRATIYAFEPFPASFAIMQHKIAKTVNIIASEKAIADKPGKRSFFVNRNVDTNSLLMPQKMGLSSDKQVENKQQIEVEAITIDDFCREQNVRHIDILKLDIQGGELAALKGAERMLQEKRVRLIYSEAYFREQYVQQPLFHDISKYLKQFDYYLQDIYNPIYGKGSIAWCDAVFLPS